VATFTKAALKVERLAGTLGASVSGLDLAKPLDPDVLAAVRQAFLEHLVLVFPGQGHITPEQQVAFAAQWGELQRTPAPSAAGRDDLIELAAGGDEARPVDPDMHETAKLARFDVWHADQTFEERPPLGTMLLARRLPSAGGDTMFANQYLAFEALAAPIRDMLMQLRALHSGEGMYRRLGLDPDKAPRNVHPVVRTHPETGRRCLFVNRIWTRRIEGVSDEESKVLLEFLYEHSARPEFTFRHRWSEGDLLLWDNRSTLHYAIRDYGAEFRTMHRATIIGDKPVLRQH
jgi:taurine dioxygenase